VKETQQTDITGFNTSSIAQLQQLFFAPFSKTGPVSGKKESISDFFQQKISQLQKQ
jgi:hypothetical protein